MGNEKRRQDESGFHIYPQPHRIRSQKRQEEGNASVTPSLGSIFDYSGTFVFSDLLDLSDIEGTGTPNDEAASKILERVSLHRDEVRRSIKNQVTATLQSEVFGGDVPHDLDDRADVGGWIHPGDVQAESEINTEGDQLSATQHLHVKVHLFHEPGDDPRAVVAKTTNWIANVVARRVFEQFTFDRSFWNAADEHPELFDVEWHNQDD